MTKKPDLRIISGGFQSSADQRDSLIFINEATRKVTTIDKNDIAKVLPHLAAATGPMLMDFLFLVASGIEPDIAESIKLQENIGYRQGNDAFDRTVEDIVAVCTGIASGPDFRFKDIIDRLAPGEWAEMCRKAGVDLQAGKTAPPPLKPQEP